MVFHDLLTVAMTEYLRLISNVSTNNTTLSKPTNVPSATIDYAARNKISGMLVRLLYNVDNYEYPKVEVNEEELLHLMEAEWKDVRRTQPRNEYDVVFEQWTAERRLMMEIADPQVPEGDPMPIEVLRFLKINDLRRMRLEWKKRVMKEADDKVFKEKLCRCFRELCMVEGKDRDVLFWQGLEMQDRRMKAMFNEIQAQSK
jgi:hypothetical protein